MTRPPRAYDEHLLSNHRGWPLKPLSQTPCRTLLARGQLWSIALCLLVPFGYYSEDNGSAEEE